MGKIMQVVKENTKISFFTVLTVLLFAMSNPSPSSYNEQPPILKYLNSKYVSTLTDEPNLEKFTFDVTPNIDPMPHSSLLINRGYSGDLAKQDIRSNTVRDPLSGLSIYDKFLYFLGGDCSEKDQRLIVVAAFGEQICEAHRADFIRLYERFEDKYKLLQKNHEACISLETGLAERMEGQTEKIRKLEEELAQRFSLLPTVVRRLFG